MVKLIIAIIVGVVLAYLGLSVIVDGYAGGNIFPNGLTPDIAKPPFNMNRARRTDGCEMYKADRLFRTTAAGTCDARYGDGNAGCGSGHSTYGHGSGDRLGHGTIPGNEFGGDVDHVRFGVIAVGHETAVQRCR